MKPKTSDDPPPQWWFLFAIVGLLVVFLAMSERSTIAKFLHQVWP